MPTTRILGTHPRRLVALGLLAVLLGVAVWRISVHTAAWSHFKQGKSALERENPTEALRQFSDCLQTWPEDAESHFLAAQAARRAGDLSTARRHLNEASRFGWPHAAIEVEEALLRAASGDLAWGVHVLLQAAHENHPDSPEIVALLVPALLAEFRLVDADGLAAKWTELRPQLAKAWAYHADILERLGRKEQAVSALRQLVKLTPEDKQARLNLARLLIDLRRDEGEAAEHLEWLMSVDPKNPAVSVQLAACREVQGRPDEAISILDRSLVEHPSHAPTLHLRGRFEMNRGRPEAAREFLRRAVASAPADRELLYSYFLCVQQVGTPAEIRAAEEQWKQCDADLKRVAELGRAIATTPDDPNLRREMGELFLRNHREVDGLRWLDSALKIDPKHAPTHRVLADYYDRTGKADLAARHRNAAGLDRR
jgi:Flp pilus assembly protein TadD